MKFASLSNLVGILEVNVLYLLLRCTKISEILARVILVI